MSRLDGRPSARTGGERLEGRSWRAESQVPWAGGRVCMAGTRCGRVRPTVCAPPPLPRVRRAGRSRQRGHLGGASRTWRATFAAQAGDQRAVRASLCGHAAQSPRYPAPHDPSHARWVVKRMCRRLRKRDTDGARGADELEKSRADRQSARSDARPREDLHGMSTRDQPANDRHDQRNIPAALKHGEQDAHRRGARC